MTTFVTLAQANRHLRLDLDLDALESGDELETELTEKLDQAEQIVLDYIGDYLETGWDADSPQGKVIAAAILIVLSGLWEDREGTGAGDYLADNGTVARLLVRIRTPTLA